jgi:hypothetical protein
MINGHGGDMTPDDGLAVHRELARRLLQAARHWRTGNSPKLGAFVQAVEAFNIYARATNAPADVCAMLGDMLGEFTNLWEGRQARSLKPQKLKNGPRVPVQREGVWAAALVFIDHHGGTADACARAERKLKAAGCPLPSNQTASTSKPGASLRNWRKEQQRRQSRRKSGVLEQLFEGHRAQVDRIAQSHGVTPGQAAERALDVAIKNFGVE